MRVAADSSVRKDGKSGGARLQVIDKKIVLARSTKRCVPISFRLKTGGKWGGTMNICRGSGVQMLGRDRCLFGDFACVICFLADAGMGGHSLP
jgi:hypothetical protein